MTMSGLFLNIDCLDDIFQARGRIREDPVPGALRAALREAGHPNAFIVHPGDSEEQVIVLPGVGLVEAQQAAERLRRVVCETTGTTLFFEIPVACVALDADFGDERMIVEAARRLIQARRSGDATSDTEDPRVREPRRPVAGSKSGSAAVEEP